MNETELLKEIKEKLEYLKYHNKNYTNKQYNLILEIDELIEDYQGSKVLGNYDELDEEIKDALKFSLYPQQYFAVGQAYDDRLTDKEAKDIYEFYNMQSWTLADFKENGLL